MKSPYNPLQIINAQGIAQNTHSVYSPVRWRYRSACFGSTFRIRFRRLSLSGDPVSGRRGPPPSSEGVGDLGIGSIGPSRRSGIKIEFMMAYPFVVSSYQPHEPVTQPLQKSQRSASLLQDRTDR